MERSGNTLNLVGDGDEIDILEHIEAVFGVTFSDAEAVQCETVGTLYELLAAKLDASNERRPVCFTAVSFYRLRRALYAVTGVRGIGPKTRLDDLFPGGRIGAAAKVLKERTGMELPDPELGTIAGAVFLILFWGCPVLAIALSEFAAFDGAGYVWIAGWALIYPLVRYARYRAPAFCTDAGGLARAMAGLNHRRLSTEFGVSHRDDVWNALVEVCRNGTRFSGPIDRETRFFASAR